MKELSLNILDIATNSVTAKATLITVTVRYVTSAHTLTITIADNGCGMSPELLARVKDPFTTSRTTRRVGLGIPLFSQSACCTMGSFDITSQLGVGTTLTALYNTSHIDCAPLGNLTETVITLLLSAPNIRWRWVYAVDEAEFVFDTEEVKGILGDMPLTEPQVLTFLKEYIKQNINTTNGGKEIL